MQRIPRCLHEPGRLAPTRVDRRRDRERRNRERNRTLRVKDERHHRVEETSLSEFDSRRLHPVRFLLRKKLPMLGHRRCCNRAGRRSSAAITTTCDSRRHHQFFPRFRILKRWSQRFPNDSIGSAEGTLKRANGTILLCCNVRPRHVAARGAMVLLNDSRDYSFLESPSLARRLSRRMQRWTSTVPCLLTPTMMVPSRTTQTTAPRSTRLSLTRPLLMDVSVTPALATTQIALRTHATKQLLSAAKSVNPARWAMIRAAHQRTGVPAQCSQPNRLYRWRLYP